MKHSQILWKRLLSAALVGAVAVAPVMGNSVAQADSHRDHSGYQGNNNQNSDNNDNGRSNGRQGSRHQDRSQGGNQQNNQRNYDNGNRDSHTNTPHDNNVPRQENHSYPSYNQHDNNSHTANSSNFIAPFRGNHDQDDNWHRSHGYVQNGSQWFWHGHDDNYWHSNGYSWNGSAWLKLGNVVLGLQFHDNHAYDRDWHLQHGYIWRDNAWYWHDHDDAWWIDNGYYWNGALWVIANNFDNSDYGPFQTFTGIVTSIDYDDNEFDIRINDDTYNVYPVRDLPERLSVGDIVQVHGQRYGNNDIRNSDFTFTDN
jgi:hypothetical protein